MAAIKQLTKNLAFWICILAGLVATNATAEPQWKPVELGAELPKRQLLGLNGPSRSLSSYRGKPLIINVWASWCEPCRAEMASLEQLAWIEGMEDINIIGISTDDYAERAQAFLNSRNTAIRHYIDQNLVMEKTLGADRLPLTVFVNAQGQVVNKIVGAKTWNEPKWVNFIKGTLFNNSNSDSAEK